MLVYIFAFLLCSAFLYGFACLINFEKRKGKAILTSATLILACIMVLAFSSPTPFNTKIHSRIDNTIYLKIGGNYYTTELPEDIVKLLENELLTVVNENGFHLLFNDRKYKLNLR